MDENFSLISVDTETTGLNPKLNHIIELGSIKASLSGKIIDTFSQFSNPGYKLPKEIKNLTGIDDSMLEGAESPNKVVSDWYSWTGSSCIFLAHNAAFDLGFLYASMPSSNLPNFENDLVIDTLSWSRKKMSSDKYRLEVLLEKIGYRAENSHRATDDAKGAIFLAAHIIKTFYRPRDIQELSDILLRQAKPVKTYLEKPKAKNVRFSF